MVSTTWTASRPHPALPLQPAEVSISLRSLDGDGSTARFALLEANGRTAWAAVRHEPAEDTDPSLHTDFVRLGRFLWSDLEIRPGAQVSVQVLESVPEATEIHLTPPTHLSVRMVERVKEALLSTPVPMRTGSRVPVGLGTRGSSLVLRVKEVSPAGSIAGPGTEIHFTAPSAGADAVANTLADVGGMHDALAQLRALVELPLLRPGFYRRLGIAPPRGVLLYGPPGTGKSLVSRSLAHDLSVKTLTLAAAEVVGGTQGETEANLRHLFSHALSHAPALIVIDEFDVIGTRRDTLASQGDVRATSQLLSLMDGLEATDGIVVIATTNRVDAIDPAFRRPGRFEQEIYVGPPDRDGRDEILSIHTRDMPLAPDALAGIADATAGYVGADLMHLARTAGLQAASRLAGDYRGYEIADALEELEITVEAQDFRDALERTQPSSLRESAAPVAAVAWDEIVGHEDVKRKLLALAGDALGSEADGPVASGIEHGAVLSGPPGVGKTILANALAARTGANVLVLDPGAVFTQWLGQSEEGIRRVFDQARRVEPCIVVLEHLEVLVPLRSGVGDSHASDRVHAAIASTLDQLTGHGIFVLGLTNRLDLVDESILRPGRLGAHLVVAPPAEQDRRELARAAATQLSVDPGESVIAELAELADGLTHAQVLAMSRTMLQQS